MTSTFRTDVAMTVTATATSTLAGATQQGAIDAVDATSPARFWSPVGLAAESITAPATRPGRLFVLDNRARRIRSIALPPTGGGTSYLSTATLAGASTPLAAGFPMVASCVPLNCMRGGD